MVSWKHTYKISAKPRLNVQEQVYYFGVTIMEVSYKKLWKLLIDKDMKKKDLCVAAGISHTSVAKLGKNENVTTDVLVKICTALKCDISDIMEIIEIEGN